MALLKYLWWKEKETMEMKTLQELGLPHTAVYFKIVHDGI